MHSTPRRRFAILLALSASWVGAVAQVASAPAASREPSLFAVEIKVGSTWDPAKPPQEQSFFKEHSTNLRRMREAGTLVMGARYSDKGLVVVSAASAADVKAQLDQDPSFAAGTFVYDIHPFSVFYAGELKARARR